MDYIFILYYCIVLHTYCEQKKWEEINSIGKKFHEGTSYVCANVNVWCVMCVMCVTTHTTNHEVLDIRLQVLVATRSRLLYVNAVLYIVVINYCLYQTLPPMNWQSAFLVEFSRLCMCVCFIIFITRIKTGKHHRPSLICLIIPIVFGYIIESTRDSFVCIWSVDPFRMDRTAFYLCWHHRHYW